MIRWASSWRASSSASTSCYQASWLRDTGENWLMAWWPRFSSRVKRPWPPPVVPFGQP